MRASKKVQQALAQEQLCKQTIGARVRVLHRPYAALDARWQVIPLDGGTLPSTTGSTAAEAATRFIAQSTAPKAEAPVQKVESNRPVQSKRRVMPPKRATSVPPVAAQPKPALAAKPSPPVRSPSVATLAPTPIAVPPMPKPSESGRRVRYARPAPKKSVAADAPIMREVSDEDLSAEVVDVLAALKSGSGVEALAAHLKVREKQLGAVLKELEDDGFVYSEQAGGRKRWHLG